MDKATVSEGGVYCDEEKRNSGISRGTAPHSAIVALALSVSLMTMLPVSRTLRLFITLLVLVAFFYVISVLRVVISGTPYSRPRLGPAQLNRLCSGLS